MGKLLIVGTVAFDEIETPFGKSDKILGGAATFIGLAATQFEVDSAIVSIVGDDLPKKYLDLLENRSIDISGIEVVKGGKTFYWKGKYRNDLNSRETLITEFVIQSPEWLYPASKSCTRLSNGGSLIKRELSVQVSCLCRKTACNCPDSLRYPALK